MRFRLPLVFAILANLAIASGAVAQVVIPPIAPPKPAVERNPNALVISTGDLKEAVNLASQSRMDDALTSFNLFKDDWAAEGPDVRAQADAVADAVDAAIARVQAALDDATADFEAFRALDDAIEEANARLARMTPTSGLRIGSTDLAQSVNWAGQGNLVKAHDEFNQFRDGWGLVRDAVRAQSAALADGIDAATAAVQSIIANPAAPNPTRAEYYPALQRLQQAVADANAQLAREAAAEPAATAAVPPAPGMAAVQIRGGNLGESLDAAHAGDLTTARSEFKQFQGDWARVMDDVRQRQAVLADRVEAALSGAQRALEAAAPVPADYVAALESLQRTVNDVNAELGKR